MIFNIKQYINILSNKSKFLILFLLFSILYFLFSAPQALAGPYSNNYQLLDYGFGTGGTASSSSINYMMQGIMGEVETASLSSTNYIALPGLTYALEPNTPAAPTLTNPSNYYNKLKIVIDNGGNSIDTTFAIQISTDVNFLTNVNFIQADNTLSAAPVFQTYTAWGGATGFNIIGLMPGTTYYARVAARRGTFQQGKYSAPANAATVNPSFSFNIQTTNQASPPFTIGIGVVNPGQVTTSWQKVTATISTNANNGGLVYVYGANNGLRSTTDSYTINSTTNDLNSALEGYGARGTTVSQTSGGPMEIIAPYNGSDNSVGIVDGNKRVLSDSTNTPVTNGQTTFELKAKASNTTPSATDYTDTITLIGTGSF
jgi:hypothetical protein